MNYMIDIETLSTHPSNALILSIGVVPFGQPGNIGIGRTFYPDLLPQLLAGREVDPDTLAFWRAQSPAAQRALTPLQRALPVEVCREIAMMMENVSEVWARGIVFDLGNLETFFQQAEVPLPWKYNQARDVRTMTALIPERSNPGYTAPENLEPHNAADDCVAQIYSLWRLDIPPLF